MASEAQYMVSNRAGTPYGSPVSGRAVDSVSSSQPLRRLKWVMSPGSMCGKEHWISGTYWNEIPSLKAVLASSGEAAAGERVRVGTEAAGSEGELEDTAPAPL